MAVPHSLGKWEIREGFGRCHGEGCKKTGGGMVAVVGFRELSPGIEEEAETILLCGDCFAFVALAVKSARETLKKERGIRLVMSE